MNKSVKVSIAASCSAAQLRENLLTFIYFGRISILIKGKNNLKIVSSKRLTKDCNSVPFFSIRYLRPPSLYFVLTFVDVVKNRSIVNATTNNKRQQQKTTTKDNNKRQQQKTTKINSINST